MREGQDQWWGDYLVGIIIIQRFDGENQHESTVYVKEERIFAQWIEW